MITDKHNITRASRLFHGRAYYAPAAPFPGVPFSPLHLHHFGAVDAAVANGLINAATSTELPNDETKTYTFPGSSSPVDGSLADGVLDTPRNVVAVATDNSAVVAMTITITGKDQYGQTMTETLQITATGTEKTATGKKAFKQITKIDITSASDATGNTLNIGTGNVLGLPHRVDSNGLLLAIVDGALDADPTFAPADATTPSATTGDVRGTIEFDDVPDGTSIYSVLYQIGDARSKVGAYGLDQYAG